NQVEQAGLAAHFRKRAVQQAPYGRRAGVFRLPLHEELLSRGNGAVTKPLRIAARKEQLCRREKSLVEDFFLIGNELAYPVPDFDRAALQLDYRDSDTVEIDDEIGSALVSST